MIDRNKIDNIILDVLSYTFVAVMMTAMVCVIYAMIKLVVS